MKNAFFRRLTPPFLFLALLAPGLRADEPDENAPAAHPAAQPAQGKPARRARPSKAGGDKSSADKARDKAFRAVQRGALAQLKNKLPEQRAEALEKLKEFPTADCAKLLVQQGLMSKHEDVRRGAYATLCSFRDSEEVCDYLLSAAEKDAFRGTPSEVTCAMLSVPLSSDAPPISKKAFDLFDKAAGRPKGGLMLLVSLADLLGAAADETSVTTLARIAARPVFNEQFGVRRSVVQALAKIEEKEAVDALVTILGQAQGEVRADIVRHLTAISGQQFGIDPPAWADWWKTNKENFAFPPAGARAANRAVSLQSRSMYYDMPIYAARLVFVIDTSGSMRGPRIDAAKRELINAVNALPEGVYFDILAFDRGVRSWQRQLLLASAENKSKASNWVNAQGEGGATASYDALEAALDFDAESIFFLTDGAPRGGKVEDPVEIVEVLSRLNFTRRVTINAIGIGVGLPVPGNPFHAFLSTLAKRNYGEYRAVNE